MEEDRQSGEADTDALSEQSQAARLWYETRLCIGFLTRIPVFKHEFAGQSSLAAASWAFPVAGLVVGLCGALALWIAATLGLGANLAALLAIATMIVVTGALHEDGLADTTDGFGLVGDAARRLEAMHDVQIGAFGVLALVVVFAARWAALADVTASSLALGAETLVAAAVISRGLLPYVMYALANARSDGLSFTAGRPEAKPAWIAIAISAVIALLTFGLGGAFIVLIVAALVAFGMALLARKLIGGQTGDVLGAIQLLVDAAVLATAVSLGA